MFARSLASAALLRTCAAQSNVFLNPTNTSLGLGQIDGDRVDFCLEAVQAAFYAIETRFDSCFVLIEASLQTVEPLVVTIEPGDDDGLTLGNRRDLCIDMLEEDIEPGD